MVASSIPGMSMAVDNLQKLSVIFVPATIYQEQQRLVYFGPFLVPSDNLGFWRTSVMVLLLSVIVLPIALLLLHKRRQSRHQETGSTGKSTVSVHDA